jgi:hypothetical protein
MGGQHAQKPQNIHGLTGVRGRTLCRRPQCRRPVDEHALETLHCPNSDTALSLSPLHRGASQSFTEDEITWVVQVLKMLRNGADVQVLRRMVSTREAGLIEGKFIRMQKSVATRMRLQKETP